MSLEARTRIDSHRLMKVQSAESGYERRISDAREEIEAKKRESSMRWRHRALLHAVIFSASFIFSLGTFTLGILLFVKPGEVLPLLIVGLVASAVFVACFSWLRMFILHRLLNEYPNKEEDPGSQYHLSKSIAYGIVALVFAIVIAGLVMNIASAEIF